VALLADDWEEAAIDRIRGDGSAETLRFFILSTRVVTTNIYIVDASLLWRGDSSTFLAFPQILICHPCLDVRCELGPQIHKINDVLVDNRRFCVYWIPTIPSEAI
jgi:hypothetical protein